MTFIKFVWPPGTITHGIICQWVWIRLRVLFRSDLDLIAVSVSGAESRSGAEPFPEPNRLRSLILFPGRIRFPIQSGSVAEYRILFRSQIRIHHRHKSGMLLIRKDTFFKLKLN
jgi:hypothetical protein